MPFQNHQTLWFAGLCACLSFMVPIQATGYVGPSVVSPQTGAHDPATFATPTQPDSIIPGPRLAFSGPEGQLWGLLDLQNGSAEALALEAQRRMAAIGGPQALAPSLDAWELWLVLNQLLEDHPSSREALLIRRNRFYDIDMVEVARAATVWLLTNPGTGTQYNLDGANMAAVPPLNDEMPEAPARPAVAPAAQGWFAAPPKIAKAAPNQNRLLPKVQDGVERPMPRHDLFERLKSTSVIVIQLGTQKNGLMVWAGHGSGSFITPTLVLTNTHVVETAPNSGVIGQAFFVVNKDLGISRAEVRARGQAANGKGVDAAVVEVLDTSSPAYLTLTDAFVEGDPVVLSGFAAKASNFDQAFNDLKEMINSGVTPTEDHIPSPKFSSGNIQAIFFDDRGEETISADVEATGGASGSPLVNSCGQMVALLYAVSRSQVDNRGFVDSSMYNLSASAREVMKMLDSARVPYTRARNKCQLE